MATITQRLPGYIEGTPEIATFDTLAELLAVPFVAEWRARGQPFGDHFYRFSQSHVATGEMVLMAEFDKGAEWYVVGWLLDVEPGRLAALPRWVEPPEADGE